jgi:transposase
MHEDHEQPHREWRIPDELWEHIVPLLPPRKPHPLGCHRPRVDDRKAMDAIFFVLRTGCQWNALNETGICSSSAAHRRFQEWTAADVFLTLWKQGLVAYQDLHRSAPAKGCALAGGEAVPRATPEESFTPMFVAARCTGVALIVVHRRS